MNRKLILLVAAACVSLVPAALAHHSFAAFNASQQLTMHGTVVALEWKNPHSWLQVEAADAHGVNHEWGIELGAPAAMLREGWRPRIVAPGDKITVTISPNRNGSYGGSMIKAVKADGTIIGGQTPQ